MLVVLVNPSLILENGRARASQGFDELREPIV